MNDFSTISKKLSILKEKRRIGGSKIKKFINHTSFSKDSFILSTNFLLYSLFLFFISSEYTSDWKDSLWAISLRTKGSAGCLLSYFFILLIYFYNILFAFWLKYGKNSHQSPQSDFNRDLWRFSNQLSRRWRESPDTASP